MDATVDEVAAVLKQGRANGKVIIGMKLFGAGRIKKPEQRDASLRYVFQNHLVDAMTIGMLDTAQVDNTIERIDATYTA